MFIDHISMYADHPEKLKTFYENYFGGESNQGYKDEKTGQLSYYITFDGGGTAKLELIHRPNMDALSKHHIDLGYVSLAFRLDTKEDVDNKIETLKKDGYVVLDMPHETEDGYYSARVLDPEDNRVELVYGLPGGLHCPVDKQRPQK